MSTEQPSILRNAMLFSLTRYSWSNRRQADRSKITGNAQNSKLNVTKSLIESAELSAINKYLNEIYVWSLKRAMPSSALRRGIYFVHRDQVSIFEAKLAEANKHLQDVLVPAFIATYDAAKEAASRPTPEGLGELFDPQDYPSKDELRGYFGFSWSWLALSVPDDLPEEIRARENAKLRESFAQAQEDIKFALRAGFQELIKHAIDRLTPEANGSKKVFRNSLLENFHEFFDTFSARNFLEDQELATLVSQAKNIVTGVTDVNALRADGKEGRTLRNQTVQQFAQVNEILGGLVEKAPRRHFNFDE